MRSKDKQNKHKLKFDYIHNLQLLGKIWKNHTDLVNPKISKDLNSYNEEVVKLMSKNNKDIYCSLVDKCDDIAFNIRRVDESLKKSHQNFKFYKKIILKYKDRL